MQTITAEFLRLTSAVNAGLLAYPLAELNDLLTGAAGEEIEALPPPSIGDRYRLNYVTAMVELAAHRVGVIPPLWTADVKPSDAPVFIDPSINLRAHLLTASPPPFRRRIFLSIPALGIASSVNRSSHPGTDRGAKYGDRQGVCPW